MAVARVVPAGGLLFAHTRSMRVTPSRFHAHIAVLTTLSLLGSSVAPLVAQAPKAATKTAAKTTPATAAPVDGGWPRAYTTASGAALVLYQPQIASWVDQKHVVAYAAVSYTPKGATKPALGTVKVESDTNVALDERLVNFSELKIAESNFPTLQRDQLRTVVAEIAAAVPLDDAGDRARPRAGQHRHEPDHPEERRRREGGSAADLLQQDAGGARQHRRRSDLGADREERPEVGGQHQLGSLPARVRPRPSTCATTRSG